MATDKLPVTLKPVLIKDIPPGVAIYYTDPSALWCDENSDCWLTPYALAYPTNPVGVFVMRISNLNGTFQILQSTAGTIRSLKTVDVYLAQGDVHFPVHFVLV